MGKDGSNKSLFNLKVVSPVRPQKFKQLSTKSKWMYFPLFIKSDINSSKIGPNIEIRKITEKECERWLGVKDRKFDKEGRAFQWKSPDEYQILKVGKNDERLIPITRPIDALGIPHNMNLINCNYILKAEGKENKKIIDMAIRLCKIGNGGLSLGFSGICTFNFFGHPYPYFQKLPTSEINKSDLYLLRKIYKAGLKKKLFSDTVKQNKALELGVNKYVLSISSIEIPLESRFLDLCIVLEMLFLPRQADELKFRLSVRAAKVFQKELGWDSNATYQKIKNFYDIRSGIAHNGYSKKLNDQKFLEIIEVVRESLLLALFKPELFDENFLNSIVLS